MRPGRQGLFQQRLAHHGPLFDAQDGGEEICNETCTALLADVVAGDLGRAVNNGGMLNLIGVIELSRVLLEIFVQISVAYIIKIRS